jgi:hypothetical protein
MDAGAIFYEYLSTTAYFAFDTQAPGGALPKAEARGCVYRRLGQAFRELR